MSWDAWYESTSSRQRTDTDTIEAEMNDGAEHRQELTEDESITKPSVEPPALSPGPQQETLHSHGVAPEHRLGYVLAAWLELTSILHHDASADVYTAADIHTEVLYAVKALSKVGHDSHSLKRQQRQIKLHHLVSDHPNVVSMVRLMDSQDCRYVVLEFCPEGDLFTSITENRHCVGNDPLIKRIFSQMLDAVEYCHSLGVYHRALKPENWLLADQGLTVKLCGFGSATADYFSSELIHGSSFHMSPEYQQLYSVPSSCYSTALSDVWSLGILLVNLASGRNPWRKACRGDPAFDAYLEDPFYLKSILPLSDNAIRILSRIFELHPDKRIAIPELRKLIVECPSFTMSVAAVPLGNVSEPPAV